MASVIFQNVSWPTLLVALLVFGFAPGAVLRLIALAYPRDHPRRRELRGELYAVPRIERPFWVFEQLEVGLCEGLPGRFARMMARVRGVPIQHAAEQGLLYGFRDILVLKVVKRLLNTGISLHQIRAAVQHLREYGTDDLAQITLMSDGTTVYECTSAEEVVDLLQGGQGVFGIALGRFWHEVDGALMELSGELHTGPSVPPG